MSTPSPPRGDASSTTTPAQSKRHSPYAEEAPSTSIFAGSLPPASAAPQGPFPRASNEFALPRRDTATLSSGAGFGAVGSSGSGIAGPRSIPFYAGGPSTSLMSATKELTKSNSTQPALHASAGTHERANVSGSSGSVASPARISASTGGGNTTPALSHPLGSEHELPGKLFGPYGSLRHSGVRGTSVGETQRKASLPNLASARRESAGAHEPLVDTSQVTAADLDQLEAASAAAAPSSNSLARKPIEEELFYADVLFMWMGVTHTQYFTYDQTAGRYALSPDLGSAVQRQAAETFQECGTLARHIDVALRQPSITGDSFLQQSLRSALRRQLTQYHYLVSMIRERRSPPLHMGDLVVAYKRVQPKLWTMECVLRETQRVKGGELASKMQQLVQQGSHRLSALLSDIYIETVSPLLHMTVESITKGEVCDPLHEFYIVPNDTIDDTADNFWVAKYALNTEVLPSTVPETVAQDILLATKNIRFIGRCCRAKQWRMDPLLLAEAERTTFDTLPAVVHRVLSFTNTAVLRLIREEFELFKVLRLVNAFLLVGYGDFYELLITKLEPILAKMSSTVHVSVVRDQMQSALAEITPYAKHLDTDRFTLLHCEMIKDEGKLGWDGFVVTMPLPSPLNNIFDHTAMKVYRRLFRLMFRVKVAEVSLKKAWRQNVMLDRLISSIQRGSQEMTAWREVAADAHLLGLQLNHFVNNLWSYIVAEVCTVAQDLLLKAIGQCASMDDIRTAHNTYLAYLTQRSLLHSDCAAIRMNVENVLTIVREYCGSQALLASLLQRGSGDLSTVMQQYQGLTDDFHREMSSLLTTLEEQHVHFDFLNFLLLRLNFNRYYHDTSDTAYNTEF